MDKSEIRGQAALEFMMTYGWAILVILAAIGALSYFGVLNPSRFTPDTCLASSPFSCQGKPIMVNTTALAFSLVNGQGYAITIGNAPGFAPGALNMSTALLNLGCSNGQTFICPQGNTACVSTSATIEAGQGVTVRVNCGVISANIIKGDLKFFYQNRDSQLTESVLVTATVKPK